MSFLTPALVFRLPVEREKGFETNSSACKTGLSSKPCEPSRPTETRNDVKRASVHTALAVAARDLLRLGLAPEALVLLERLASLLTGTQGPTGAVIPIGRGRR